MVVTGIESVTGLMSAALAAGVFHTWLGPDHYLPLLGFAKAERWKLSRALSVTAALGVAHCALGLILVLGAGSVAGLLELQLAGANPLALLWVGLGAAVLVSAWRWHRAGDGADDGRSRPGRAVRWLWFVGFVLGPCEWLWPFALPALDGHGVVGLMAVAGAYTAATVFAMTAAVAVGLGLGRRWHPGPIAARAAMGVALVVSGGFVLSGF